MSTDSDQSGLWQNFLKAITGQVNGVDPKNVIGAGSGFPCDLASLDKGVPEAQLYALGNTIPPWSLNWNGATNPDLFSTYQQFVNLIHPENAVDPDSTQGKALAAKMAEVKGQIATFTTGVGDIRKGLYAEWLQMVCGNIDESNPSFPTCKANGYFPSAAYPTGSAPDPTVPSSYAYYQQNLNIGTWGEKVQELTVDGNTTLMGLQSEYATYAQQYFGAGYQTISEAQNWVALADPLGLPAGSDPLPAGVDQVTMLTKEGGSVVRVPLFFATPDLSDFRAWMTEQAGKAAVSGPLFADKADVQVTFDHTTHTHTESGWSFSVNVGIPIDWFWLGAKASGSHTQQFDEKTEFQGTITYQAVTKVMFGEGKWFDEALLNTYANFLVANPPKPGDPFYGRNLWGPSGVMNVVVKGVIVGYAPYLRLVMKDWQNSVSKTSWSTGVTFGIGPFNFESGSASGFDYKSFAQEIDGGIEVRDTSGQPKVIALIVETPNWTPVS